jgi:hypothetical protein
MPATGGRGKSLIAAHYRPPVSRHRGVAERATWSAAAFPRLRGCAAAAREHALVLVARGSEEVETAELLRAVSENRCRTLGR